MLVGYKNEVEKVNNLDGVFRIYLSHEVSISNKVKLTSPIVLHFDRE